MVGMDDSVGLQWVHWRMSTQMLPSGRRQHAGHPQPGVVDLSSSQLHSSLARCWLRAIVASDGRSPACEGELRFRRSLRRQARSFQSLAEKALINLGKHGRHLEDRMCVCRIRPL